MCDVTDLPPFPLAAPFSCNFRLKWISRLLTLFSLHCSCPLGDAVLSSTGSGDCHKSTAKERERERKDERERETEWVARQRDVNKRRSKVRGCLRFNKRNPVPGFRVVAPTHRAACSTVMWACNLQLRAHNHKRPGLMNTPYPSPQPWA